MPDNFWTKVTQSTTDFSSLEEQNRKVFEDNPRVYSTYSNRVISDFQDTWKSIKDDAYASTLTSSQPSKNHFVNSLNSLKRAGKIAGRATGLAVDEIQSPFSALFSGFSSGNKYNDELSSNKLSEGTSAIFSGVGKVFEGIEKGGQKGLEYLGVDPLTSRLTSKGAVGIGTGIMGESAFGSAISKFKANRLASLEKKVSIAKQNINNQIKNTEAKNIFASESNYNSVNTLISDFATKIENNTATNKEKIQIKKQLKDYGVKDTSKIDNIFEEQFSKNKIDNIVNEKVYTDIENKKITTKSKNPNISKLVSSGILDIKKNYNIDINDPKVIEIVDTDFGGDFDNFNKAVEDFNSVVRDRNTYEGKLLALKDLNTKGKADKSEKYKAGAIEEKTSHLSELTEGGFLKEEIDLKYSAKSKVYGYKLTEEGKELARGLGYSESDIKFLSERPFAHTPEKDLRKYQISKDPELLQNPKLYSDIDSRLSESKYADTEAGVDGLIKNLKQLYIKDGFNLESKLNKTPKTLEATTNLYKQIKKHNEPKSGKVKTTPESLTDTSNILKSKTLAEDIGLPDIISERVYDTSKINIEKQFKERVRKLSQEYRDKIDLLKVALFDANKRRLKELYELGAKYKKYGDLKAVKLNEIRLEAKAGRLYGKIDKVINRVTQGNIALKREKKSSSWYQANSPTVLQKEFDRLDKAIAKEDIRGIQREIIEELTGEKLSTKGTTTQFRKTHTPELQRKIIEAKTQFEKATKGGQLSREDLIQLLEDIRDLKSKSKEQARIREIDVAKEVDKAIADIELEGINNIEGLADAEDNFKSIIKGTFNSIFKYNNPIIHNLEKVFGVISAGKVPKGIKVFWSGIKDGFGDLAKYEADVLSPLAHKIINTFSETERIDWGISQIARQVDKDKIKTGKEFIGIDRLVNDKEKASYFEPRETSIGNKPDWLSDDWWNGVPKTDKNPGKIAIKDTKLGELLEKSEIDTKWIELRDGWNKVQKEIGDKYKAILAKYDGIDVNLRDDYFYLMTKNYLRKIDLNEVNFRTTRPGSKNGFETVETTAGKDLAYEADPIIILLKGSRQALNQIYLRDALELASQTWIGKQRKFSRLSEVERNKLLATLDKDGNPIYQITDIDGNIIGENSDISIDKQYITNTKKGLKTKFNKTTNDLMAEYLNRASKGGFFQRDIGSRYVQKGLNQLTANFLAFNPSSIAVQGLTFLDALVLGGVRDMSKAVSLIQSNPKILKQVEEISTSFKERKGPLIEVGEILDDIENFKTFGGFRSFINKYNKLGLSPLKIFDAWNYKRVWLSSYIDFLETKKIDFLDGNGDLIDNIEAQQYADAFSDKIAGSSSAFNAPQAYGNILWRAVFTLGTQLTSRYSTYLGKATDAFKKNDYYNGTKYVAGFMAINSVAIAVPYLINKSLFESGLTDKAPEDFGSLEERLTGLDAFAQVTIGNAPILGKALNFTEFGTYDVISSTAKTVNNSLKEIKGDKEIEGILDFINAGFFKKPTEFGKALVTSRED